MRRSECALRTAALAFVAFGASACTQIDNALASVPVFAFLREAPSFDPYEMPRLPAPGSVPFSGPQGRALPPMTATEASLNEFAASEYGQDPYVRLHADEAWLAYGRTMFERHCAVCHGPQGEGDGPVVGQGKFPLAPTLVGGTALGRSEGYIYGIIRVGRGLMPAYGGRTTDAERWAIVNYVTQLQGRATTAPAQESPPAAPSQESPPAAPPVTDTSAIQPAGVEQ